MLQVQRWLLLLLLLLSSSQLCLLLQMCELHERQVVFQCLFLTLQILDLKLQILSL